MIAKAKARKWRELRYGLEVLNTVGITVFAISADKLDEMLAEYANSIINEQLNKNANADHLSILDGKTVQLMITAPVGAVYVWCNDKSLDYARALSKKLRRNDLLIVSPNWIIDRKWIGWNISGIVVDHAVEGSTRFYDALTEAKKGLR